MNRVEPPKLPVGLILKWGQGEVTCNILWQHVADLTSGGRVLGSVEDLAIPAHVLQPLNHYQATVVLAWYPALQSRRP